MCRISEINWNNSVKTHPFGLKEDSFESSCYDKHFGYKFAQIGPMWLKLVVFEHALPSKTHKPYRYGQPYVFETWLVKAGSTPDAFALIC